MGTTYCVLSLVAVLPLWALRQASISLMVPLLLDEVAAGCPGCHSQSNPKWHLLEIEVQWGSFT